MSEITVNLPTVYRTLHAVAVISAATAATAQWSFVLDTTFRTVITQKNVNAAILLPDSGLFLSGRIRFPGDLSDRGGAKFLQDGSRDLTFPQFPLTTGAGKIVPWSGQFYVSAAGVRRMTPGGLIDQSFITMNASPYFYSFTYGDYHVYADGAVLASGQHLLSDSTRGFVGFYDLIWFSNTGYLDTTKIHRQSNGIMWEFKELPDGKFICSCSCTQYEGHAVDKVFRVHPDGALDTTFHTGINAGNVYAYFPLPDGRVYVGGNFRRAAAPNYTLYLVRLLPDGSLDPAFSNPHLTIPSYLPSSSSRVVRSIRPWSDGAIIACGQFDSADGQERWGICMLDTSGQVLPAFGNCEIGPFTSQGITNVAIMDWIYGLDSTCIFTFGYYTGYDDGTVNDTLQRFVSRLLVEELSTRVEEAGEGSRSLTLFPNPADRTVLLNWDVPDKPGGRCQLSVVSAQGQLVRTVPIVLTDKSYALDVSNYAAGLYHLHLVVDGQWVSGVKVVIE